MKWNKNNRAWPYFWGIITIGAVIGLCLMGCPIEDDSGDDTTTDPGIKIKVSFDSGNTSTVNLAGLQNNTVYLVKVNKSASVASAANTGSVSGSWADWSDPVMPPPNYNDAENEIPQWFRDIQEFNANPPLPLPGPSRHTRAAPASLNDQKTFWVQFPVDNNIDVEKTFTLRAQGTYGNVWVANDDYLPSSTSDTDAKITLAQAQAMAAKFDQIYPIETSLLGYEYGGGVPSGDSTYGGKDGDTRIQILVYNFGGGNTVGYFWGRDYYPKTRPETAHSNVAEVFYLDSASADNWPDSSYSTLVHEFQHMINFNVKFVQNSRSSASWYDEMLAMMAEDVICPLIGIPPLNPGHPVGGRISSFLPNYHTAGVTDWNIGDYSYPKGFAFGAYLARNYGGAELLRNILQTNTTDIKSLDTALGQLNPGVTFLGALEHYGEALVFSGSTMPTEVNSFDKTVTKKIGIYTYTNTRFNIWDERYILYGNRYYPWGGPKIFSLTPLEMRPHSVLVQSSDSWKNKSGSLSITLNKPASGDVVLYLMVR